MENYTNPYEMYHWGIKGMKWGRRRYQNKDGSLTPEGRKRYGDKDEHDSKPEETPEQKRARILKSTDAKEIYENRDLLTTQELNDRIFRIDTEARLKGKIVEPPTKTTMDHVNDALDKLNTVTNAYDKFSKNPIGAKILEKAGLKKSEDPFEFDIDDFVKNINKKSHKEVEDVSKRMENAEKITKAHDKIKTAREEEEARIKAEKDAKKSKKEFEKWQKEVNKYNKRWQKDGADDKVSSTTSTPEGEYAKKGTDINNRYHNTYGNNVPAVIRTLSDKRDDDVFRFEATAYDVVDRNGNSVVTDLPSTTVNRGRSTVSGLLESDINNTTIDDLFK